MWYQKISLPLHRTAGCFVWTPIPGIFILLGEWNLGFGGKLGGYYQLPLTLKNSNLFSHN